MTFVSYKEILSSKANLAPSQLSILDIPNKNVIKLRDLLSRKLTYSDNGSEVGSVNYISNSTHYFIRAKALQSTYLLPSLNKETITPIRPKVFMDFKLKEGDILISKDSNVGEAVILDRDYPNYTISGALYKLPIIKNKYYILSFLKHRYFKDQLDLLVPKGSTIRHAKTLFLDCKIPFPNQTDSKEVIKYVESLMIALINKQKEIKRKDELIFKLIEEEVLNNQKPVKYVYENPSLKDISHDFRLDAGFYCEEYKKKQFLISNYINGASNLKGWNYTIKRGQNLQVSQIGKSIYSDHYRSNYYTLIRPTCFSDMGTVEKFEYLGNPKKLSTLETGDIAFSAEGTVGKCVLFAKKQENWITNIHGIILNKQDHNIKESAFVACFLRFLKKWEVLDYISVGGQGGSLAMKYWRDVKVARFPEGKKIKIADMYHKIVDYPSAISSKDFAEKDLLWNKKAGILELDLSIKDIEFKLSTILDQIVENKIVVINY